MATYRIGIDIGGTFTDLTVVESDTGEVLIEKTLTTPSAPEVGVLAGIDALARRVPGLLGSTPEIVHATTLVTNVILERKGARTALLTTEGFRDVLEMAREVRYDVFDMFIQLPAPLVSRDLRFTVRERMLANGQPHEAPQEGELRAVARRMAAAKVEAVAISFLHAHTNPAHELRAAQVLREELPGVALSLSHEVSPEPKEYERTSTAVVDAYVKSVTSRYLDSLQEELARRGFDGALLVMLSNGGAATISTTKTVPVQIVESGPAAGVEAAAFFARKLGARRALAFDMGGTTAKLCLVRDGTASRTREFEVDRAQRFMKGSGLPLNISVYDLVEIGAGGGSIARVSDLGLLQVGPDSAGSEPGPVCYGRGGGQPTVTDADLVLGYLDPRFFLGGDMPLDAAAAATAIEQQIARPLGLEVVAAAAGIYAMVNETMASAARMYLTEQALAATDVVLFASGGAGSLHAVGLARKLGCRQVIVPPFSGVLSSLGLLTAAVAFERSSPAKMLLDRADVDDLAARFLRLEVEALEHLPDQDAAALERSADLRFAGQDYALEIPSVEPGADWRARMCDAFMAKYQELYGRTGDPGSVEVVQLRVRARQPSPQPRLSHGQSAAAGKPAGERRIWSFQRQAFVTAPVYRRDQLGVDQVIEGPAVIEERIATAVLEPGDRLVVDASGCLHVTVAGDAQRTDQDHKGTPVALDPVTIQLLWSRIVSVVDEAATGLMRTAYTPSVKEYHDFCCAVFDPAGRMLAHSTVTTAGFLGIVPAVMRNFLAKFPRETLQPGDVIITNDPWLASGHLIDISVAAPIFQGGTLVGFALCIVHHLDMGGRMSTLESKDLFEEGLKIPIMKLYDAGREVSAVYDFIRANTRVPDKILGDLNAQLIANNVCARGVQLLLEESGLAGLDALSEEITSRTERSLRAKIAELPPGVYRNEVTLPPIPGVKEPIHIRAAVTIRADEIVIDYTGSSQQVTAAINCTPNIVKSYSSYPIKLALDPEVPNNDGSLRPITIVAPEGSVVNARPPAATWGRTMIAHLFPDVIYGALESVMPERVLASNGGAPANEVYLHGKHADGRAFMSIAQHTGGFGASARGDGYSTLCFPFNTRNIPVEVIEAEARVLYLRKEFLPDSGGPGLHRGGLGQQVEFRILDGGATGAREVESSVRISGRTETGPMPAFGRCGGRPGRGGGLWLNGAPVEHGVYRKLQPGDVIRFEMTGGGGYGDPLKRNRTSIERDIAEGKVTAKAAMLDYKFSMAQREDDCNTRLSSAKDRDQDLGRTCPNWGG